MIAQSLLVMNKTYNGRRPEAAPGINAGALNNV